MYSSMPQKYPPNIKRFHSDDLPSSYRVNTKKLPFLNRKPTDIDLDSPQVEYLSLLDGLNKLCDSYDQVPSIEFESQKSLDYSQLISHTRTSEKKKESNIDIIIKQLKKRLRSYPKVQAAYPSSSRFKVSSTTEEKIGPGTYKPSPSTKQESYEFSNIPRLHTPIAHTLNIIESLYKHRENSTDDQLIKKNKLLAISPLLKEEILYKNLTKKQKGTLVKEKKDQLDCFTQTAKKFKLKEKIRKFEWRMSRSEVAQVQKSWTCYALVIGMTAVLNLRTNVRRVLRIRWRKIFKKFCVICKSIGKWARVLRKVRKRRLLNFLTDKSLPVSLFIEKQLTRKKKMIMGTVDRFKDSPFFIVLQAKWGRSIQKLQKNWRDAKTILKARKFTLNILWEKLSENMHNIKLREKIHKGKIVDRYYVVGHEIKEKFIIKYMKNVFSEYSKERKIFWQKLRLIKKEKKEADQDSQENEVSIKKPVLLLYSQNGKMQEFIEKANLYKFKLDKRQRELRYKINTIIPKRSPIKCQSLSPS